MKTRNDKFLCRATLAVSTSDETLARKHFVSASDAADWALLTAQHMKLSLGPSAYDKIDDELTIEIGGHFADDPTLERLTVFVGSLATASAQLAKSVAEFEQDKLPKLRIEVAKRAASRAKRRYWVAAMGAGTLAVAVIGVLLVPPILDPERVAEAILSGPPPAFAGRWAIGDPAANCQTNFIDLSRRRYEAVVGSSRQSFVAAYSQTSSDVLRVEYAQGGIKLAQLFRLSPQTGLLTIVNVESSEPEIATAARRVIGTVLTKCPA